MFNFATKRYNSDRFYPNAVLLIELSDVNRTNILVEPSFGFMIRDPLFVEQTRWTTQNAMNMTTTRTEIKIMSWFANKFLSVKFNSSNRIVVGQFEEVDLQLVDTEIFTVNRSRLYQLKKSHISFNMKFRQNCQMYTLY